MKIEANQWYRTRSGEIAYVAAIVPFTDELPVLGLVNGDICCWSLSGLYFSDDINKLDLVEHLPDCDSFDWVPRIKIQLQAGKKYVLENGEIVGPMVLVGDPVGFCWVCDRHPVFAWQNNGVFVFKYEREKHNIVAEYVEPKPIYEPWSFEDVVVGSLVLCKTNGSVLMITGKVSRPTHARVSINGSWSDIDMVFRNYTQLDGSPCGKIKK